MRWFSKAENLVRKKNLITPRVEYPDFVLVAQLEHYVWAKWAERVIGIEFKAGCRLIYLTLLRKLKITNYVMF